MANFGTKAVSKIDLLERLLLPAGTCCEAAESGALGKKACRRFPGRDRPPQVGRAGYPIRLGHADFWQEYRLLALSVTFF